MQRERRRDPYPWTWEIPVAVALATLFVIVIGIQLGRSVANLLAGAGWTWPDANAGAFPSLIGTAFWTSLPGVLGGHREPGAGQVVAPPVREAHHAGHHRVGDLHRGDHRAGGGADLGGEGRPRPRR